jgi:WD40 repeat protein
LKSNSCATIAGLFAALLISGCNTEPQFPKLTGPYLGQEPPGVTPAVFAPGIISLDGSYEGGATFSADGNLFAYKRHHPEDPDPEQIWISEQRDGVWSQPTRAPFDGEHSDWDFAFAPYGNWFYFTSRRPASIDSRPFGPPNIWMTERTTNSWTEPHALGPPVNDADGFSGYASLTNDGAIYFHSARTAGSGEADIYYAPLTNGRYQKLVTPPAPLNTGHKEIDPAIAPDGSYLVFLSDRPGGTSLPQEMYLSFRRPNGDWTAPQTLAPTLGDARLPIITPDGRYLFYAASRTEDVLQSDIYWVSTALLEQNRP